MMEVNEFFDLLESNKASVVDNIKELIQENMHSVKDPWLVNGLFDYYLQTNSDRCMDVLTGVSREPHDKFLIEKILEGLRNQSTRKASVTFLGHLVRKQPSWLYKIVQTGLVKELISILKTDTDIVVLLTGLLVVTSLLPILPVYLIKSTNDLFDVFARLTTWAHTSHNIPEPHLLHLQVGLYSLFHRLYAMYPCNFLSYLRYNFGSGDKRTVFTNTIKPMLETVKMHPMLVTASKEGELSPSRWKNKEYDEIIAECALLSLDVLESGLPEEANPIHLRPKASSSNIADTTLTNNDCSGSATSILRVPVSNLIQQSLKSDTIDLSSLATLIEDTSAPPTPSSFVGSSSVQSHPHAPLTATVSAPPLVKTTVSPPETAMEATPENTPIQTPVKDRHATTHFKLPTSPAVKHLNFGRSTPPGSAPSSPAPHTAADSVGIRRDSIFDTSRRDSILMGRLEKIILEQQQQGQMSQVIPKDPETQRRPVPLNLNEASNFTTTSGSLLSSNSMLMAGSVGNATMAENITGGGPLTPMLGSFPTPDSHMEIIDDVSELEELKNETVPMPDKKELMAFAQRVRRLRFYSQCTDQGTSGGGPSPLGSSPSSQFVPPQRRRSASCPDVYKKLSYESFSDFVDGVQSPSSQQVDLSDETSTPKAENVQSYELLFHGALPSFLQHAGQTQSQIQSPHHLLDLCITKAAALHGMSNKGDEVVFLKGQVELLHAQLLFERHRREAHALRNRSLAKRCRNVQQQGEKSSALANQLNAVEKEVAILKSDLVSQRAACNAKEKEYQQTIESLESKVRELSREIRVLKENKIQDDSNYSKLSEEFKTMQKQIDEKMANIFRLESEIKECKRYVSLNANLKVAYETSQKEFLLLGELYRKQQEIIMGYDTHRYILHEMDDLRLTCENEISTLKALVEQKSSQTDAALQFIQDLETQLSEKDQTINKQKKLVHDASSEYDIQIKALEDKYESIKSINHRLELEILNLQHQLTIKTYSAGVVRTNVGRRISPANGDSPHNSNNSDVDSAASAGGFQLSPEQSVFIFGSPQFGTAPMEMNDLQRVIGDSEAAAAAERQNSPRRTSSSGAAGAGRLGGATTSSRTHANNSDQSEHRRQW